MQNQRQRGRQAILDAIRRSSRVARIDIARKTGLSQATVTTITAELLREGLIEETARKTRDIASNSRHSRGRRGRPRIDLKMRGSAHIVAGVKIAHQSISTVIVDFEGNLLAEHEGDLRDAVLAPIKLAEQVRQAVRHACQACERKMSDLSAVGVGMSGIIDAHKGFVHWSPSLSLRNVTFADTLGRALGKPVFVDNDSNLAAMAEQYFGHGIGISDFLVVTVESGVGIGIVLGHEIYRGTRGCGAEFGHTKVHLDGALCRCGQRGCLEAYVADYALLREASVADFANSETSADQRVLKLLEAARNGETLPRTIVERAGRMFAMGLANLVNLFDPQLIVLSGERMAVDHLYADEVIESIRDFIVQVDLSPPEIIIHKWGDFMWARGASAYALQNVAAMSLRELSGNVA